MLRIQNLFLGSLAICVVQRPPGVRAHTRRVLMGVLFTFLLGSVGASAAPAQEQERPERQERQQRQEKPERPERQEPQERLAGQERVSDWATDNLDLVSATPAQIREVLAKDAGLMVELKRLMANRRGAGHGG